MVWILGVGWVFRLATGMGMFAKRVLTQQAKLVRPMRGGGGHQEAADPAKYGKFLLPHVSNGHKRMAHVRCLPI